MHLNITTATIARKLYCAGQALLADYAYNSLMQEDRLKNYHQTPVKVEYRAPCMVGSYC
jgi:hypothetical protein